MSTIDTRLPADVATHYELTTAHTRIVVRQLGHREVDLTKLTLAEAAELVALPGGFEWLRRKPQPEVVVQEVVLPTQPSRRRAPKSGGPGGK